MTTVEKTRSGQAARPSGSDTARELKDDAARLTDDAKSRLGAEADKRKGEATSAARSTSDALEKAASHLKSDGSTPGWLASAFRETAKGIDRFAGKMDGRSAQEMGREVTSFARENPTGFLAASAAAGFAAARFLRAGADHKHHRADRQSTYRNGSQSQYVASPTGSRFADEARMAQQRMGESRGGTQ